MSFLHCGDLSFGLIPKDIQVENAKINQVLAACDTVTKKIVAENISAKIAVFDELIVNNQIFQPVIPTWQNSLDTITSAPTVQLNPNAPGYGIPTTLLFPGSTGETAGSKLIFDSNQSAFRAGIINGGQWDELNRGFSSVSFGEDSTASGFNSGVLSGKGNSTTQGYAGIVAGQDNSVSGGHSVIGGGLQNLITNSTSIIGAGTLNVITGVNNIIGSGQSNQCAGSFSAIDAGQNNSNGGSHSLIGSGQGNSIIGNTSSSCIGAGISNQIDAGFNVISTSCICTGTNNTIDTSLSPVVTSSCICGGISNQITALNSFIGAGNANQARGQSSVVGGGENNVAGNAVGSFTPIVCGGNNNQALGSSSAIVGGSTNATGAAASASFIGGGGSNVTGPSASNGVVCGGFSNSALGNASTVGGGQGNQAQGLFSTVPGGNNNQAGGTASFAAGTNAQTSGSNNCFVWGDSGGVTAPAASPDTVWFQTGTLAAAATPVFTIYSSAAAATGVQLNQGAGAWAAVCDRNAKENLRELSPLDILNRVEQLPIYEFNYKGGSEGMRCRGPVAQDWHVLFPSEKHPLTIDTMDLDGISLAAIKGLALLVRQQQKHIQQLQELWERDAEFIT